MPHWICICPIIYPKANEEVQGLVLGTYDGIAGLIAQPYIGARDNGVVGAALGMGKGLAGLPVKFFAGKSLVSKCQ